MDLSVDIIEVLSDGRYKLYENQLQSILSKTQNCHNFALISIIDSHLSGKSSLMNCFISYLESNQRKSWPKDHIIKSFDGFNKSFAIPKKRVIQMWNKPFIIEKNGIKTVVFLMDSSHVFEYTATISYTKLVEDIIGLFLTTSSTVIYFKFSYILSDDLSQLKKASEKCLKDLKTIDSFEELFFVIRDWDPKIKSEFNRYSFGSKTGKRYLKEQFSDNNMDDIFENIECCLMPSSDNLSNDLEFNKLGNDFKFEITRLLKSKLLNVNKMKVKRHPITKKLMTTTELFNTFKSYVNKLNGESVIDFGINFQKSDKLVQTVEEPEQTSSDSELLLPEFIAKKEKLNERHSKTMDTMDDLKKTGDQVMDLVNSFLHNKTFGEKEPESDITKSARFQFRSTVGTYDSIFYRSQDNKSDSDKNKRTDTKKSEDMYCQQTDKINDSKDINDFVDVSDDDSMNGDIIPDNSFNESQMTNYSELMEVITNSDHFVCTDNSVNDCKMTDISNEDNTSNDNNSSEFQLKNNYKNIENNNPELSERMDNFVEDNQKIATSYKDKTSDQITEFKPTKDNAITLEETFENCCEMLCNDYKIVVTNQLNSEGFNLERGFPLLHRNTRTKILYKYDEALKKRNKIDKLMKQHFREELLKRIEKLMPGFKKLSEELYEKFKDKYNGCLEKTLIIYENKIQNTIEREFDLKFNESDLRRIHKQLIDSVNKVFAEKVSELDKTNNNITISFKDKLRVQLNSKLEDYLKSLKTITSYINEWQKLLSSHQYLENNVLSERHSLFKNKLKSDLNPLIIKLIDKSFAEIVLNNKLIKNREELIIGPIKGDLFKDFDNYLSNELKNRFYNQQDFEQIFNRNLSHTLNKLKSEIVSTKSKTLSEYLRKSEEAKTLIERARSDSINLYSAEMNNISLNSSNFQLMSDLNLSKALKHNKTLFESIKSYFTDNFYEIIFENNIKQITDKIKAKEETLRQTIIKKDVTTEPNSSVIAVHFGRQYLFAGVYDNQYNNILDKNNSNFRPNCIAFGNEILYGYDAKNYVQSFGEAFNQDFDIKNLLLKKRSDLKEELNSYPFEFLNNNNNFLRVRVKNVSISCDFSIESLIALQVLDIKADAEHQLSTKISKAVFTVPTHYTIKERNAFRDVATIAGLDSVHILSEITAAAIGYSFDVKPQNQINLLVISVNEFDCEGAIIKMNNRIIEYQCYLRENLIICEKNIWKRFKFIIYQNDLEKQELIKKHFERLLEKLLKGCQINKRDIDHIILLGASTIFGSVKEFISQIFKDKQIIDCSQNDLVVKGSAIYGKYFIENNSEFRFDVSEVAFHSLKYQMIANDVRSVTEKTAIHFNKQLDYSNSYCFSPPFKFELPIKFNIYQDDILVAVYHLRSLSDQFYSKRNLNWSHSVSFGLTNFNDLKVFSKLAANNGEYIINNQLVEYKLGMTGEDLNRDKQYINVIESKTNESKVRVETKSVVYKIKDELNCLYLSIKKRFDDNKELRGLKKKRIEEQLKITEELLQNSEVELKIYENQKTILENIKTLNF